MAIKQVVTPTNLGLTIKAGHITAGKYDVQVDGVSILADGSGVLSTAISPATVNALITLSGLASGSTTLGTFSGTVIPDNVSVKAALQALETAFQTTAITGQYLGSASTFAALPTTDPLGAAASNGDWAILDTVDGTHAAGIYVYNGSAFTFGVSLAATIVAATAISPAADNGTGAVGTSVKYAREDHKHPAQAPSTDATNLITTGTDGLHKVTTASVKGALTFSTTVQDAFGTVLFYANDTTTFV